MGNKQPQPPEKVNQQTAPPHTDEEALRKAAMMGEVNDLRRLIEEGVDPNAADQRLTCRTALHEAAAWNQVEIVRTLVDLPRTVVNARENYDGWTPLHLAAIHSHVDIIEILLQHRDIDINDKNNLLGRTPLHIAVDKGHQRVVQMLLQHRDININEINDEDYTALMMAAEKGRTEMISELLQAPNIDMKAYDEFGDTALLLATSTQPVETIRLLLEHQPWLIRHANKAGDTALLKAAVSQPINVLKYLLDNGADIRHTNKKGDTAIMIAIQQNSVEVFEFLLESGSTITAKQCDETTALHKVALHGSVELLQTLLSLGASVNHLNSDGQIALHRACQSCDSEMVQVLLKHGSFVDVQDKDGFTPLHVTAKYNAVNCASSLLKAINLDNLDIILNIVDKSNRNLLTSSFYFASEDVIKLLIKHLSNNQVTLDLMTLKEAIGYGVHGQVLSDLEELCDDTTLSLDTLAEIYRFPVPVQDAHTVDAQGQSLLHYAYEYGIKSLIEYVLEKGADINLNDKNGVTPLNILKNRPAVFGKLPQCIKEVATEDILTLEGVGAASVIPESRDIIEAVEQMLRMLQKKFPKDLSFTPFLSGSSLEGTKSGVADEFDYLCILEIRQQGINDFIDLFEAMELDNKQTGTKKNFVCVKCPHGCLRYAGEGRRLTDCIYTCLDYVKVCSHFNKHLTVAVEELKLHRLPEHLYIYRQVQITSMIPRLHLKWRGEQVKDLNISVDIVPTLRLKQKPHGGSNKWSLKELFNIRYAGDVLAIAKCSGFDNMKYHMRLTFSDIETKLVSSVPLYCRLAYILLKSLRHPAIYKPQVRIDGIEIKTEEDLPSYTIKSCLMFVVEEEGLIPEHASSEDDSTDLPTYIQQHHTQILDIAAKVIRRIKDNLKTLGGVPSFFNRTYDILFGYSLAGDYNINKLNADGPRKERKDRIVKFCDFVISECIDPKKVKVLEPMSRKRMASRSIFSI